MASRPTESPLATWAPSTSPLAIEYSKSVVEEIRARAVEGYYRLARGGVEVAGVLIGEQNGDQIRILAQEPFEIEYAFGPSFLLSARDHAHLRKLLEDTWTKHSPLGHKVLGLYISHSRGDLSLTDTDLALFQDLFPHHWQTVLVLKPSRAPETPAAFFVREPNGLVRANRSHLEFELAPQMGERRARLAPPVRAEDPSLRALASAASSPENAEPIPAIRQLVDGQRLAPPPAIDPGATGAAVAEAFAERVPDVRGSEVSPPPLTADETCAKLAPAEPVPEPARPAITLEQARELISAAYPEGPVRGETAAPVVRDGGATIARAAPEALETPAGSWEDEQSRAPRASSWLRFAIPVVGLFLVAILGYLVYVALNAEPPRVVFFAQEGEGVGEVVWQLSGIRDATSAVITVERNGERKSIDLIQTGQLSGVWKDPLVTPEALVTLEVQRASAPGIERVAPWIRRDSAAASLAPETLSTSTPGDVTPEPADPLTVATDAGPASNAASAVPAPVVTDLNQRPLSPAEERGGAVRGAETVRPDPVLSLPQPPERLFAVDALPAAAASRRPEQTPGQTGNAASPAEFTGRTAAANVVAESSAAAAAPAPRTPTSLTAAPPPALTVPASSTGAPQPASSVDTPSPSGVRASSAVPASGAVTASGVAGGSAIPPARSAAPSRARAGRVIWTGQLRKNQILQVNGGDANQGAINGKLPGEPVRLNVLPGELTSQGLVVYTANPRYRDAANAVEPPGPTNGWNETRYRYDPLRANSVIVTAIPNQTNRWQGLTVRNEDKTVNVIVIDWLAGDGD